MEPETTAIEAPPKPLPIRAGDVVMHSKQFNRLCHLMRTRLYSNKFLRETVWNGARVHIDDGMPESGWFIVPGTDA